MIGTELTVTERAALALESSAASAHLIQLAASTQSITTITNKDGRTECHAAAMRAADARIAIEKTGKAARDDATKFSKAVIAEEARLVAIISPEEKRLKALRDEWDEKVAAAKAAEAEAERLRILAITERIGAIKFAVALCVGQNSDAIHDATVTLAGTEIDDSYAEFYGEAVEAKADTLRQLTAMFGAVHAAEDEALRIKEAQAAEQARLKAEREEQLRLNAIEREKMAAERAELNRIAAEQKAEADRIAAENARLAAIQCEAEAAKRIEAERVARESEAVKQAQEAALIAAAEAERAACQRHATVSIDAAPVTTAPISTAILRIELLEQINIALDNMSLDELQRMMDFAQFIVDERRLSAWHR